MDQQKLNIWSSFGFQSITCTNIINATATSHLSHFFCLFRWPIFVHHPMFLSSMTFNLLMRSKVINWKPLQSHLLMRRMSLWHRCLLHPQVFNLQRIGKDSDLIRLTTPNICMARLSRRNACIKIKTRNYTPLPSNNNLLRSCKFGCCLPD